MASTVLGCLFCGQKPTPAHCGNDTMEVGRGPDLRCKITTAACQPIPLKCTERCMVLTRTLHVGGLEA